MPGKNYIKVSSILLIIASIGAVILYPIAGLLLQYATIKTGLEMGEVFIVICVLYTVAAVLQLIAGVKGVKGCNDKSAASSLKTWGKVILVVAVLAGVVNIIRDALTMASMWESVAGVLLGLVLPALYIYGASLNEKA